MKTLRLFMLTAAIMCSLVANAQDVIVKNDGSTITSKVMEITGTEIKYKKYSNLKGPTYTINKTDVNYINYENGERENFDNTTATQPTTGTSNTQYSFAQQQNQQQMSDAELLRNLDKDPYTIRQKKSKNLKLIGFIGGGALIAAGVVLNLFHEGAYDYGEYDYYDGDCLDIIGYASIGAGAVWATSFILAAQHQKKKALYSANTSTPLMQFNLSQSKKSAIYANINMLNDNVTNRKALGVGMNFNF